MEETARMFEAQREKSLRCGPREKLLGRETRRMTTATATAVLDRVDALHGTGTDVRGTTSAFDALADAGLAGWNVTKKPVQLTTGEPVPGVFSLARTDRGLNRPLKGVSVGRGYTVVNYEQNAALLDAVATEIGGTFDSSGLLDGGTKAFLSIKLDEEFAIGGVDPVTAYLVAFMGHGGTSNVLAPTAIRAFCANQQRQISQGNKLKIVIRHTLNAPARMELARETLKTTFQGLADFKKSGELLLSQPMVDSEFKAIVDKLYPLGGESLAAQSRYDTRMGTMRRLFNESETNANIRGTAWAGFQAVSEYAEHFTSVAHSTRGGDGASITDARSQRALTDAALENRQNKAFGAFMEFAK
jgi:phage/plasmid-like protein (TIGR03299 family)